uniref:Uncharacterized protein n=1 Tax=Octopus bimaculoides TaxID=37653 RepID=A0A0L8HN54_OCTBM
MLHPIRMHRYILPYTHTHMHCVLPVKLVVCTSQCKRQTRIIDISACPIHWVR